MCDNMYLKRSEGKKTWATSGSPGLTLTALQETQSFPFLPWSSPSSYCGVRNVEDGSIRYITEKRHDGEASRNTEVLTYYWCFYTLAQEVFTWPINTPSTVTLKILYSNNTWMVCRKHKHGHFEVFQRGLNYTLLLHYKCDTFYIKCKNQKLLEHLTRGKGKKLEKGFGCNHVYWSIKRLLFLHTHVLFSP